MMQLGDNQAREMHFLSRIDRLSTLEGCRITQVRFVRICRELVSRINVELWCGFGFSTGAIRSRWAAGDVIASRWLNSRLRMRFGQLVATV